MAQLINQQRFSTPLASPGRNLLGIQKIDEASRQCLIHARDDRRRDADDAVVQALPEDCYGDLRENDGDSWGFKAIY